MNFDIQSGQNVVLKPLPHNLEGPISAQGGPTLTFDTSGINRLAEDHERLVLRAAIRVGFRFRLTGDAAGELIATPDAAVRKALLDLCRSLLSVGDCLLPHDELLSRVARAHAGGVSFDWAAVPVRCRVYEDEVARQELIDDAIAEEQRQFAGEVGNGFAEIYERARPHFQKIFRKYATSPPTLPGLVDALQRPGGAFWTMAVELYLKATGVALSEARARDFVEGCPPFRALLMALCVAQHQRSIQNPRRKSVGAHDLYMSVYLPYCDQFITADTRQRAALAEVSELAKLSVRVRSYTEFRAALLGLSKAEERRNS